MTQEEIKRKVSLTSEQTEILNEMNGIFKKMKEAEMEIVFDHSEYSFAAINKRHIAELQDYEEKSDNAVDIENCVEWGNVFGHIHEYGSYYGNLHAVFK